MNNQKEFQNISIIDLEEKENESILIEENFDTFQVNLTIPIFGEMEEESIQKNHEVEGFEVVNQFKDTHLLLIQNETVICENHIVNEALKVNDFLPDLIEIESFSELGINFIFHNLIFRM